MQRNNITDLVISSHNKNKISEYQILLNNLNIQLYSALQLDIPEPKETGTTFEENALIKAKIAGDTIDKLSLGEDSGLVINALDGFPGIRSGRWANEAGGYSLAFKKLEFLLENKPLDASFQIVIALYCPRKKDSKIFRSRLDGFLKFLPEGNEGFGYDPIFVPKGYHKSISKLGQSVKRKLSHRAKCCKLLKKYLFE